MKIKYNKLFFYVFVLLWAGLIIFNLIKPEKSFSESENRYLSKMPGFTIDTLINGKYMSGIDTYLDDQFIVRDTWITAQSIMEYGIGKRESNGVFICDNALMDNVKGPNDKYVDQSIEGINYFQKEHNIPSTLMIIPSAAYVQRDKLPVFAQAWDQNEFINSVYGRLENVTAVSVYDTLYNHKDEYIYYRTDHHWTTYGAFLSLQKYCETLNLPVIPEYKYNTVSESFNGTLYSRSGVRFIKSDVIDAYQSNHAVSCSVYTGEETKEYSSIYFDENLDKKDKYAYFLGPNEPVVTIKGNCGSGKKLLMFKDSYAHCFAPMLLEYYSEVTLVDLRYINQDLNNIINIKSYDSALFLYSVDSFANQNNIIKLKVLS